MNKRELREWIDEVNKITGHITLVDCPRCSTPPVRSYVGEFTWVECFKCGMIGGKFTVNGDNPSKDSAESWNRVAISFRTTN